MVVSKASRLRRYGKRGIKYATSDGVYLLKGGRGQWTLYHHEKVAPIDYTVTILEAEKRIESDRRSKLNYGWYYTSDGGRYLYTPCGPRSRMYQVAAASGAIVSGDPPPADSVRIGYRLNPKAGASK